MRNKEKYLSALLTSDTLKEAAEKAGVTPRWLREILKDPEFSREYNERKTELLEEASRQLANTYQLAVTALRGILTDPEAKAGEKTSAARAVLEYGSKITETADLAARIDALERNDTQ